MPADIPGGKGAVQVLYMSYRNEDEVTMMVKPEGEINFLRLPKGSVPNPVLEPRHLLNPE